MAKSLQSHQVAQLGLLCQIGWSGTMACEKRAADSVVRTTILFEGRVSIGTAAMTITVGATYENGTLKLDTPLPLQEHERVHVVVQPAVSRVRQTAGMMGWT